MNENVDLIKILKNCPRGFKLYSAVHGEVTFLSIEDRKYPIGVLLKNDDCKVHYSSSGKVFASQGECVLFPSKAQRDWSKFTAPWLKKKRFDPKTLKPFDRVICKNGIDLWKTELFSHYDCKRKYYPFRCVGNGYLYCIPYNNDTKRLVGTTDEAPEYYRYWED